MTVSIASLSSLLILDLMKHKASRDRWFPKNGNFQERFLEMYFHVNSTHVTDTQDWLRPLRHMKLVWSQCSFDLQSVLSYSISLEWILYGISKTDFSSLMIMIFSLLLTILFYVLLTLSFSLFTFENVPSLKRTCRSRSVRCSYSRLGTNTTTDCLVVSQCLVQKRSNQNLVDILVMCPWLPYRYSLTFFSM